MTPVEMEMIVKLVISLALGAVIGIEREFNRSAAGLKTYSIVCMGSAFFTAVAFTVNIAVAAGVITGIGFLGAATIFKTESKVIGITTASLVWAVAAIGFGVGVGMYYASAAATGLLLFILVPMEYFEKKILKKHDSG